MNRVERGPRRGRSPLWWLLAIAATGAAGVLIVSRIDLAVLGAAFVELVSNPLWVVAAVAGFSGAFVIRAYAWHRVVPALSVGQAWAGLHVTLLGNHLLPLRLGEPLRIVSANLRARVPWNVATASTIVLRSGDVLAAIGLAWLAGAGNLHVLGSTALIVVVAVGGIAALAALLWFARLRDHTSLQWPGGLVVVSTVTAWVAEAVLVLVVAQAAGIPLDLVGAVLVTTVSVAAQMVAILPGGLGTYEAGAVAAYAYLGFPADVGLAAALAAHALKTVYSLVAGALACRFPGPSLVAHLRLERSGPRTWPVLSAPSGPVVLFMPAYNEEAAVAAVVERVPQQVCGRKVIPIVVDDGSSDATADIAASAGATVVAHEQNRGLGAAVRTGLADAAARGAAAVGFCDADGEYAPEELEALVQPILAGEADYVVGSRFMGRIDRMLPHRRLGNLVLTKLLAFVARHPISDGQSGYRAFSSAAAADAELIHDFNYAQVITLDLLSKGYRYLEVPISYHFRKTGSSFVRLGRYLRSVGPAIYRQLTR